LPKAIVISAQVDPAFTDSDRHRLSAANLAGQCPSIPNWRTNKTPLERENKWTFIRRKYHLDWIFKTAPGDAPMFKLIRL